jgi:hypothetical protein
MSPKTDLTARKEGLTIKKLRKSAGAGAENLIPARYAEKDWHIS